MDKISRSKLEKFLLELSCLTIKYGIVIAGCGCCGSPYLKSLEEGQYASSFDYDLGFNYEEQSYETAEISNII